MEREVQERREQQQQPPTPIQVILDELSGQIPTPEPAQIELQCHLCRGPVLNTIRFFT